MEYLLPTELLIALTLLSACVVEVARYLVMFRLGLSLPTNRAFSYPYQIRYFGVAFIAGPAVAVAVVAVLTWLWRRAMLLPGSLPLYVNGLFLVVVTGGVAGLTYAVMRKVEKWRDEFFGSEEENDEEVSSRILKPVALLAAVALFTFLVQPFRWVLGILLPLLLSSAAGAFVNVTSLQDLIQWLNRAEEEQAKNRDRPKKSAPRKRPKDTRVRMRFLIDVDGVISVRGSPVELQAERIDPLTDDPAVVLARRLLDQSNLAAFVAAQEMIQQRRDLLAEIPPLISQNLGKWAGRLAALSASDGSYGEKQAKLEREIREVLDQRLGNQMRSLLYWHYDFPQQHDPAKTVRIAVDQLPHFEFRPLISFRQYLGLFASYAARRVRN